MSRSIAIVRPNVLAWWLIVCFAISLTLIAAPVQAAKVASEKVPADAEPRSVEVETQSGRVVVDPDAGWRHGSHNWDRWTSDRWHGGPRVSVWVDRGDWATYRPGERLWVYFRVDRPCFVTIVDHAPDGRVEILYPNRWSGSNFVSPGRTYRIPESRGYSLRTAGPGGIETLVACAHELPWPSGPGGMWLPSGPWRDTRYDTHYGPGRVMVGGRHPGRQQRRIVTGPSDYYWPIHPDWRGHAEGWTCDSVSFYVIDGGSWYGQRWSDDPGWYGDPYYGEYGYRDYYYDRGPRPYAGTFMMRDRDDALFLDLDEWDEPGVLRIECTESKDGDPTEVTGVVVWETHGGKEPLFRLDVEGHHGDKPKRGETFTRTIGSLLVEVEVLDFRVEQKKAWKRPRLEWIEFGVRIDPR